MTETSTPPTSDADYDGQRRRAFLLAADGRRDEALATLTEGWTDDWPRPSLYVADVARVRFLAGDYEDAIEALDLAPGAGPEEGALELAAACVRRRPALWRRALRVVVRQGSALQRARAAGAVVGARLG